MDVGQVSDRDEYPEKCLHFIAAESLSGCGSDVKSCTAKLVHDSQIKVNNKAVNTIRRLQPFATQPDLLASAAAEDLKLALTSTPVASSAKASLQLSLIHI